MDASSRRLALTLSGLFFLMFFPQGAILTAAFTFLARPPAAGGLGLTPAQVSMVAAAGAIGNLAAIGLVHRLRAFACRRVLATLFSCAAVVTGLLAAFAGANATAASAAASGVSVGATYGVVAAICVCFGCFTAVSSAGSASAATFIQQCIAGTGLSYYRLRSAGTLGFVCGGASLLTVTPVSTQPLWLGCGALLVAAAYALLALPLTGESAVAGNQPRAVHARSGGPGAFPRNEFAFVLVLLGATAILGRLYDAYGNQFLTEFKFPYPCATQPLLAQFPEFLLLLLVPFASLRARYCLILGPLAWVCVYFGFACGDRFDMGWAIYLTLPMQAGNCIMQTTASITIDAMFERSRFRRTAQAALPFALGAGVLLGSLLAGAIVSAATMLAGKTNWNHVWLVGSSAALVVTALTGAAIAVLPMDRFKKREARAERPHCGAAMGLESIAEAVVDV